MRLLQDCETVSNGEVERTVTVVTETQLSDDEGTSVYYLPPPASASVCLPPNSDPPPFNAFAEPHIIETRGLSLSDHPQGDFGIPLANSPLNGGQLLSLPTFTL